MITPFLGAVRRRANRLRGDCLSPLEIGNGNVAAVGPSRGPLGRPTRPAAAHQQRELGGQPRRINTTMRTMTTIRTTAPPPMYMVGSLLGFAARRERNRPLSGRRRQRQTRGPPATSVLLLGSDRPRWVCQYRSWVASEPTVNGERLSALSRSIAGKRAIVTGAASGMGRATAHLFADEGAQVVVADLEHGAGERRRRRDPRHPRRHGGARGGLRRVVAPTNCRASSMRRSSGRAGSTSSSTTRVSRSPTRRSSRRTSSRTAGRARSTSTSPPTPA